MKKKLKIFLMFVIQSTSVMSQGLSLDECQQMAVENNRTLASARLDIGNASESRKEAFTAYFPEISGTGAVFQGSNFLIQEMQLIKKGAVFAVSATQPVFAGGQIVNKNKLTRVQHDMSKLQYDISERDIVQRCTEMFWLIVSLRSNISTLDAADRHLVEMMRQSKDYVEMGLRLPADTLRISLKRAELKSSRLSVNNAIKLNLMSLANLIGVEWEGFDIADSSFAEPSDPMLCFVPADEAALRRSEYALSQKQLEASRYQVNMEYGKLLPSLGIGVTGMYANLMEKGETNAIVFATLSVPISAWWGGSHAIKKAKLERTQAEIALSDAQMNLRLDIQHSWDNTVEAYEQIKIAKDAVKMAEENLRLYKDYYEAGTVHASDYLDTENIFIQNRDNLTAAYAAYQIRLADYKSKTQMK